MLQAFLEVLSPEELAGCASVRQVVCSGEALPVHLAEKFFAAGLPAGLDNLYGPTEAAIDVTRWVCRPGETRVPIGRPVANTTTYVLDRYGNEVPAGIPGELCLGGVQIALGYLNRPDLTEKSFVPTRSPAVGCTAPATSPAATPTASSNTSAAATTR